MRTRSSRYAIPVMAAALSLAGVGCESHHHHVEREVVVERPLPPPPVVEREIIVEGYGPYPPPERVEVFPVRPYRRAVWSRGYWVRDPRRHAWVWRPGYWR